MPDIDPMTPGLGVDIATLPRLRKAVERWGNPILHRLFTDDELVSMKGSRGWRWDSVAGHFAAKEAVKKILASQGRHAAWTEVEVLNGAHGEPILRLHGQALKAAESCGFRRFVLSITHEGDSAVAVVLAL
jgi:holo-[acyl-carrier protein] synthase